MLANELVHGLMPDAITIAEDVSGQGAQPACSKGNLRCIVAARAAA